MDFGDAPQNDSAYEMCDRHKELNMIIMTDCGELCLSLASNAIVRDTL